jgi:transcription initiation factor IIF auxiliary subunit
MNIIYQQENKQIAVVFPCIGDINTVIQATVPENALYTVVNNLENIDGYFFNAYEYDDTVGAVANIDKAKEIQKDKWRAIRNAKLQALDVDYIRSLETGETNKIAQIVAKKQELRDITNTPLPDNLEGIKNTWPSALNS